MGRKIKVKIFFINISKFKILWQFGRFVVDACQTSWVHILNNSLQTFCTNEAVVHLSFRHQKAAIKTHPAIGNFNSNYWLLRVHKRRNWKKKEPRRTILLFCLFIFLLKAFKTNERSNVAFDWLLTKIYWKANLIRGFQVEYNLTSNVSCCCFSSRKWPLLSVTSKKSPKVHKSCPKNIFYKINERFWHLYKNCQKCGRFGQNNCCRRLWKVAQSTINRPIWSHCLSSSHGPKGISAAAIGFRVACQEWVSRQRLKDHTMLHSLQNT